MNITIRPERQEDIPDIYELNQLVFGQDTEAKLVEHVREGPNYIPELALVALVDDKIVGYILFSKIGIQNGDVRYESLALAPMVVHPSLRKQGIGSKLIAHGLQKATDLGYTSVLVLGHEYYYPKFGFVPAAKWNIKPPFEVPADVFMARELVPNALTNISGTVEFPFEFSVM
jgi:Predicted acetyltransferase